MGPVIVTCPVCKQKLALQAYVVVGAEVVCANKRCGTSLRLVSRKPPRVEPIPVEETYNQDSRPESYG